MKSKSFLSCLIAAALICLFYSPGHTDQVIIKAGTDVWPPFRIPVNETFKGFDIDLTNELGRRLKAKTEIRHHPWGRCLTLMKQGKIDLMTGLAYRKERAQYIAYTFPPYFSCSSVFYVRKGLGKTIRAYADLYSHKIGYVLHSAYFKPFDTDTTLNKHGVTDEEQLLNMLLTDRLDTIIGTDCQVDYDIAHQNLAHLLEKTAYRPANNVDLFIGISKKSPWAKQIEQINIIIAQMLSDGFIERLKRQYY